MYEHSSYCPGAHPGEAWRRKKERLAHEATRKGDIVPERIVEVLEGCIIGNPDQFLEFCRRNGEFSDSERGRGDERLTVPELVGRVERVLLAALHLGRSSVQASLPSLHLSLSSVAQR